MKIHLKLSVLDDQGTQFIGRGPVQLLQGIERLGSINQAAKEMNLSYVKALKMIKRMEACLDGKKIVKTEIGGKEHGGAKLTPLATKFIGLFTAYEAEVANFAQEKFALIKAPLERLEKGLDP